MQINTDFNLPDFVVRKEKSLFWMSGLLAIVFFVTGIYLEQTVFYIIPFALLFLSLIALNFKGVFFIMLLVLPISVESYIGSFGTDLPSEPLVMLLAGCTILYLLFNQHELRQKSFKHPILIIILLMFVWSIFTTLFSTDIVLSVKYVLAKGWYLLGFLILPILLLRTGSRIKLFFWCLYVPTLMTVIYVFDTAWNDEVFV